MDAQYYEDTVTLSRKARLTPVCLTQPDALEDVELASRWMKNRAENAFNEGDRGRLGLKRRQNDKETSVFLLD
jgi:hypothetical protein